jgi:hypothetical protein
VNPWKSGSSVFNAFEIDPFAYRQFDDPSYSGTRIKFDKDEFAKRVNELYMKNPELVDGYVPVLL